MIDLKQELQGYSTINLKDISQNESDIPDNIRNSVFLYNKAIESLKNGSEDIAIIELKKAINMNPHFYEAVNLLGICYSYIKDNEKAIEAFDKVVKAEQNSVKALRYLSLLDSGEDTGAGRNKTKVKARSNVVNEAAAKNRSISQKQKKPFWQAGIKYFAVFTAGALVFLLINALSHKPSERKDLQDVPDTTKTQTAADDYKLKYEELLPKYELSQKDKESATKEADYYKSAIKLYEIESLANNKNFAGAADLLLLMKATAFSGEEKAKFDKLNSEVLPKAAGVVYDDGRKLYDIAKYAEALKKLEKVGVYDPQFTRMDAALYYMGKSYQKLNDSRNAITLFQKLVDSYPKSSYVSLAKSRLKTLTQQ